MSGLEYPNTKTIFATLFAGVDASVLDDNEQLERIQQNCREQINPLTCYLTLLLGNPPTITWRHRTAEHFGIVDLQYADIFALIHPAWLFAYLNYGRAMYELVHDFPSITTDSGSCAACLVPLRHKSGNYYWYQQVSVSVAQMESQLAAHLNYYHQGALYSSQLPNSPQFIRNGEIDTFLTDKLRESGSRFLPDFLREFLSASQVKFILQYRTVLQQNGGVEPSQRHLLELIDTVNSRENLDKIKQRIRKNTQSRFQHSGLDSAFALASWANLYF